MRLRAAVILAGLLAMTVFAGSANAYSRGGAFRGPGFGARAYGLGGGGIALTGGVDAVYWNPAMLPRSQRGEVGGSLVNLFPDGLARQTQLGGTFFLERNDTDDINGALARQSFGVMLTNMRLELTDGDNYAENTLRLAYAYTPEALVTFAAAFDVLFSNSDTPDFSAAGTSVDLAARLELTPSLTMAAVVRNAFSRYSYSDGLDYDRERQVAIGFAASPIDQLSLVTDFAFEHGDAAQVSFGGEGVLANLLALRAGWTIRNTGESRSYPQFGIGLLAVDRQLGLGVSGIRFDYAATLDEETAFDQLHRFALAIQY